MPSYAVRGLRLVGEVREVSRFVSKKDTPQAVDMVSVRVRWDGAGQYEDPHEVNYRAEDLERTPKVGEYVEIVLSVNARQDGGQWLRPLAPPVVLPAKQTAVRAVS